jgi:hypothetical protein
MLLLIGQQLRLLDLSEFVSMSSTDGVAHFRISWQAL